MGLKFDKNKTIARIQLAALHGVARGAIMLQDNVVAKLSRVASNVGAGGHPSPPGSPPGQNTGALARSIQAVDVTKTPMKPTYRVGTKLIYARIQEYGGRIRAKKGKFLPVPVGVDGKRAMRDAKGNLRSLNLKLVRTKAGQLLLVKELKIGDKAAKGSKKEKFAQTKILFVLKKQVYLPPRPYFRPAYAETSKEIQKEIHDSIQEAMEGGTP